MIRIGILGAASLSAGKLMQILLRHKNADIAWAVSETSPGEPVWTVHQGLRGRTALKYSSYNPAALKGCDLVFSCKRPGDTFAVISDVLEAGCRMIDFSGDYRLKGVGEFEKWYGVSHQFPDALAEAVYGLPELHRERIRTARLVANPGCYTTTAIIACAPFVRAGFAVDSTLIIDAISGVSGAGRTAKTENLFIEVTGNVRAYRVGNHQHTPEIEQELSAQSPNGAPARVLFVPHVGPYDVGIMADCYFRLPEGAPEPSDATVTQFLTEAYEREPFVRVYDPPALPQIQYVAGTNYCDVAARYDARTRTIVVFGVTDNLVKGAAGQAVQNMNIMFGIDETTGLL